ncbi:lysosomal cobalamin transport escort protein LMBD1 [Spea bombifrons]|uniref:lysosomal cobalamin transport escort protein LMBD1 n=1 Tax=Spea bombifrons TaxID=233779 RepID=UPI0023493F25|nr:lysosomal cobalamin transport escort protein LMBD1 [Spea bombifrons]
MAADYLALLIGWGPFTGLLLIFLVFSWIYVRRYQSNRFSEVFPTLTAICSLTLALTTSAILPVDIFLVSYMKNENGTFKDWAADNTTRLQIENTVLIGYYIFYSCILFCVFMWIPFAYFYYEEKDDEEGRCIQIKTALKYTFGFMMVCSCLLLVGIFIPLDISRNRNVTEAEKIMLLFEELGSNYGLAALSFSVSSLTLIGMLAAITYTAYGMSALPLRFIIGYKSVVYERLQNVEDMEELKVKIERIRSKCKDGRPLLSMDRHNLQKLEDNLRTLRKKEGLFDLYEKSSCSKFCIAMRPLKIVWGIFIILLAFLFVTSLFLTNLDKALHSAGFNTGFIIFGTNLSNPMNALLPVLQKVFPLDYFFIAAVTMYLVFSSMAGLRNMGIWFFWIRLYKIKRGRTRPQALLFLSMILLLIVLYTSYMTYSLAPQYVMYGNQRYLAKTNDTQQDGNGNYTTFVSKECSTDAPQDQCMVTRTYLFLHKFWFFSSIYYYGNWTFIVAFIFGFIVSCCKGKKAIIEGGVEDEDSELSDTDDFPYI